MEQGETAVVASMADGKCPYLAGRPPHGTYKLWPSSINVCYGRPQGDRSYGHVSKDTQERQCFGGGGVFCDCADYQRAHAASIAPPQFGRALRPDEEPSDGPVRRVRKRRRKKRARSVRTQLLLRSLVFLVTLLVTASTVALMMTR